MCYPNNTPNPTIIGISECCHDPSISRNIFVFSSTIYGEDRTDEEKNVENDNKDDDENQNMSALIPTMIIILLTMT